MRYRAFGTTGRNVSAITLTIPGDLQDRAGVALIYAALESGVNAFELRNPTAATSHLLGDALRSIGRDMVFLVLRIGAGEARGGRVHRDFSGLAIRGAIDGAVEAGRFGRFDVVLLDDPRPEEMLPETLSALAAAQQRGSVALTGLTGGGPVVKAALTQGRLGAVGVVYNVRSGSPERLHVKDAAAQGLVTFGERFHPGDPATAACGAVPPARGFLGLRRRTPLPLEKSDGYEFLTRTPGWRHDEICLAYALTEPGLSSVMVEAGADDLVRLAAVPERNLPSGVSAQIEMARFSAAS